MHEDGMESVSSLLVMSLSTGTMSLSHSSFSREGQRRMDDFLKKMLFGDDR